MNISKRKTKPCPFKDFKKDNTTIKKIDNEEHNQEKKPPSEFRTLTNRVL